LRGEGLPPYYWSLRMTFSSQHAGVSDLEICSDPSFRLVFICEDSSARPLAQQFCRELRQDFGNALQLHTTFWSFDTLQDGSRVNVTAGLAAAAEQVIVCVRAGRRLSTTTQRWFETWMQTGEPCYPALVVLSDASGPRHGITPASVCLHRLATRYGTRFYRRGVRLASDAASSPRARGVSQNGPVDADLEF
jgi:hypothetical protein